MFANRQLDNTHTTKCYQWDLNIYVPLGIDASMKDTVVDFAHKGDKLSQGRAPEYRNGEWFGKIPYKLLETDDYIYWWVTNGGDTIAAGYVQVEAREKPSDWVAPNDVIVQWHDLTNQAKALMKEMEAKTAETVAATKAANEAEAAHAKAEDARAEAENGRVDAEKQRDDAEGKRADAEKKRDDAENTRITQEKGRVDAEAKRVEECAEMCKTAQTAIDNVNAATKKANEDDATINGNEAKRKEAENQRVAQETARDTAEQGRAKTETDRVAAEKKRAAESEQTIATLVKTNSNVEDAEKKRVQAESARVIAEDAREKASAKALEDAEKATELATHAQGPKGDDGLTPTIDDTSGNWMIGTKDTGVHAQGPKGDAGPKGDKGDFSGEFHSFGSEIGKNWSRLGTWTSPGDSQNLHLYVMSGSGYNGDASQNSRFSIQVKDGWQSTPSATTSFGGTLMRLENANTVDFRIIALSANQCEVWVYLPWDYSSGNYVVNCFGTWDPNEAHSTSEPTGNSQSIAINSIVGPQGPQGPMGPQGPRGPEGPNFGIVNCKQSQRWDNIPFWAQAWGQMVNVVVDCGGTSGSKYIGDWGNPCDVGWISGGYRPAFGTTYALAQLDNHPGIMRITQDGHVIIVSTRDGTVSVGNILSFVTYIRGA